MSLKYARNAKRKTKFRPELPVPRRKHRSNLTGDYHDEERKKDPKYWHKHRPERINNPIKSYGDLIEAIGAIYSGREDYSQYRGVTGINRDRLRVAQSFRHQGVTFGVYEIMHMSREEIRQQLGYGKSRYGMVLHQRPNRF